MVHSKQTCSINPRTSTTTYYRAAAILRTAPKIFHIAKHFASNVSVPLRQTLKLALTTFGFN
ncbi:hypothetical protein HOLleu_44636 [Holothuria leucospilota]|uniref:Uncharacterized protein n=1 Tax=Holothuria leucospilota TaxID=206669 RepID=A0A9Q0YA95_HOLLE|nr:hypothetical protein HOLleu_44636 [Holothuria leucospilota]